MAEKSLGAGNGLARYDQKTDRITALVGQIGTFLLGLGVLFLAYRAFSSNQATQGTFIVIGLVVSLVLAFIKGQARGPDRFGD